MTRLSDETKGMYREVIRGYPPNKAGKTSTAVFAKQGTYDTGG